MDAQQQALAEAVHTLAALAASVVRLQAENDALRRRVGQLTTGQESQGRTLSPRGRAPGR